MIFLILAVRALVTELSGSAMGAGVDTQGLATRHLDSGRVQHGLLQGGPGPKDSG